jgi:hypothetical protein
MERDEEICLIEDEFDLCQEDAEEVWLYISQECIADADARGSESFEQDLRRSIEAFEQDTRRRREAFEQDTGRRREAFAVREAELRHERISVMAQNVKVCRGRMPFVCQY